MLSERRLLALALATVLSACASGTTGVHDSRADLYGRWRNVEMTVYLEDGSVRSQPPGIECVTQISESRSVTDCALPNRKTIHVVSKVIAWTPQGYELECIEHSVFPQAVGLRTRVEYRVEGNKRYATLYPPSVQAPGVKSPAMRMETVDLRD